jgi:hypothetical protein
VSGILEMIQPEEEVVISEENTAVAIEFLDR